MAVFISHSRQNSGAALKLCDELVRRGVKTWLDLRELDSGSDWNQKVAEAVRGADGFVFIIGPAGPADRWQRYEWQQVVEEEYYLDSSKALVPVVIGNAEMPGFLNFRRTVAVDENAIDFPALADIVIDALRKPVESIDPEKMRRGLDLRKKAIENLHKYSLEIAQDDIKLAGLRVPQ